MKHFKYIPVQLVCTGLLFLLCLHAMGQPAVPSRHVDVTFNKTSSIVFASAITSVDRGSRDVLAQKAKGVNNVLQLKAGRRNFPETNLTVITANGQLHHFLIRYADNPQHFTILKDSLQVQANGLLVDADLTESELQYTATHIVESYVKGKVKRVSGFDMHFALLGIYIRNNTLFYHVRITNDSNIPYHTSLLRFYIRDKKQTRRTAAQETEEVPGFQWGSVASIPSQSFVDAVFAIPKFTIPDAKRLHLDLKEQRGGRHLALSIRNRHIMNVRPLHH